MHPGVLKGCQRGASHREVKGRQLPDHNQTPPRTNRSSAVAIKQGADPAARPQILAKGQGAVAEQILEIAFATGVKVRTDADLIEVLEAIEVDCEIPTAALATVAEILSYLYRANGGLPPAPPGASEHPTNEALND